MFSIILSFIIGHFIMIVLIIKNFIIPVQTMSHHLSFVIIQNVIGIHLVLFQNMKVWMFSFYFILYNIFHILIWWFLIPIEGVIIGIKSPMTDIPMKPFRMFFNQFVMTQYII